VVGCQVGKPVSDGDLSPASRRGFFVRVPCAVQPTARLGVEVVGLLCSGRGSAGPFMATHMTHLAPLPLAGLLFGALPPP
jgi:hypothetical protein